MPQLGPPFLGINAACNSMRRRLVSVAGADGPKLLQGLATNDVLGFMQDPERKTMFSGFLSKQGRIEADAIIWKEPNDRLLLDVEDGQAHLLLTHIKRYRIRKTVELSICLDYFICNGQTHEFYVEPHARAPDPRGAFLPDRVLVEGQDSDKMNDDDLRYQRLRYLLGIAEGTDITSQLPLNCNLDLLQGIDWRKGCYLGQELTARTKHRGRVRKRILPFTFGEVDAPARLPEALAPEEFETIKMLPCENYLPFSFEDETLTLCTKATGDSIANVICHDGTAGLAMCDLDKVFTGEPLDLFVMQKEWERLDVKARIHVPEWFQRD